MTYKYVNVCVVDKKTEICFRQNLELKSSVYDTIKNYKNKMLGDSYYIADYYIYDKEVK